MTVAHTAYLRVFVPLSAYSEASRRRWQQYVERGPAPSRLDSERIEQEIFVKLVLRGAPDLRDLPVEEEAFVERRGDTWLVCPWNTAIRALRAIAIRDAFTHPLDEWFTPVSVQRQAESELRRRGYGAWSADSAPRVQIREQPWHVPGHWFVLFSATERLLDHSTYGVQLRYRTSMRQARRRISTALRTLRARLIDHPAIDELTDVASWLSDFDAMSMVELDYGGLARLVGFDVLELDESAADVARSLDFFRENDLDSGAEQYQFVVSRWEDLSRVPRWN